jgi:GT2 family glycosyltransferase
MALPARAALSIVIPVHNGAQALARCLAAASRQVDPGDEIIVVDDGSTEDVSSIAKRAGARSVRLDTCLGPAGARNRGAAVATRPVVMFVDADCVLQTDALARVRTHMENPAVDAVFGSYDDAPEASAIISRFKNLAHHYFHQRAAGPIASFWGACGAIRRSVFEAAGGFDERRFSQPSIEDVELGWRLADRGARIILDPTIHVTHLKRWTLRSLVVTDVMQRAVPWVRLSLERGGLKRDLNTSSAQRAAAVVAVLFTVCAVVAVVARWARLPLMALAVVALALNWRLFRLFWRKGGPVLFAAGVVLQQLYYLCAMTGVVLGVLAHLRPGRVTAPVARTGY